MRAFREIWLCDFEFGASPGNRPQPRCLVAHEFTSGKTIRLFEDDLLRLEQAPYSTSSDALCIAYFASAELSCHLALDWKLPANVLDLYVEFRNLTNGSPTPAGNSLLGALVYFGLDPMAASEKEDMRQLALRGGLYTADEREALLDYCERDVLALQRLYRAMLPKLDIPRAILRGRYMKAVAHMEHTGVPINTTALEILRSNWTDIQDALIHKIDVDFGVYEGRTFKSDRFASWLAKNKIPWPRLASGALALDDDTFRLMSQHYPQLIPLRQLRAALSEMRLADLAVGSDGRNRALLSPFATKTGRNQPSNSRFVFGPATWLRYLIRPQPGMGLVYLDWCQQEFGIAAALSGDRAMQEAYLSSDPYLFFAKQAHAVPDFATKVTHEAIREVFKTCALGVQYGMEAETLARRIERPVIEARDLLSLHRTVYRTFWRWSDAVIDFAMLYGYLPTAFGWTWHIGPDTNPRSLRNFPMQANGAEILRLACCLAVERRISVCAPIHDALLIEAPLDGLDLATQATQEAMAEASRVVLDGFKLRTEAKQFRHPGGFQDKRGEQMWTTVQETLTARLHLKEEPLTGQ